MKRGFTFERVATQVKKGSLTPQSDDPDRSPVVRALPASSRRPPPRSLFRRIREAFHRFRILFAILLTICCASPARFLELSGTNHRASIDRKRAKPITYLALGDSTGLGLGAKNGHGYVEQLMAQIQNEHPGSRLAKLCRLGETTTGLRQRLTEGFPVKPTFASLSIGINDLLNRVSEEQFAANYEEIVRSLTRLGVPIVVTNLPDVSSTPRLPKSMREEVRVKLILFNKRIESLAKRYDLVFVDVYAATAKLLTEHQEFFAADGFHPSDAGYKVWAQTMWPKVKMAIKRSLTSSRVLPISAARVDARPSCFGYIDFPSTPQDPRGLDSVLNTGNG